MQVLLLQSPPPSGALPLLQQQAQQANLPVPAADPVGMFQAAVADEEAQGRTKMPLPDTKSVPATNLNTGTA